MKNIVMLVLVAGFCTALSSCAFGSSWHKPGGSEYDTENALAQCEYEAGKEHVDRGDFISSCMKRQGFRQ